MMFFVTCATGGSKLENRNVSAFADIADSANATHAAASFPTNFMFSSCIEDWFERR
jgi:hypothetical protein